MANGKKPASNAKRKIAGTLKKRPAKSKQTEKVPESLTIEAAFKRASVGRKCPVCEKRFANAVYQRHYQNCKVPAEEEDDDIIYCGTVERTEIVKRPPAINLKRETPAEPSLYESILVTKKFFAPRQSIEIETSDAQESGKKESSASITPSTSSFMKENLPSGESRKFAVDDLMITEVYDLCIRSLEKHLTTADHHQDPRDEQIPGCLKLGSSSARVHYSLRFIWKIIQKGFFCPEHENSPQSSIRFWGDSLRSICSFLTSSVQAQQLFVHLLKRRWGWHCAQEIRYPELADDLMPLFVELNGHGLMEAAFGSGNISLDEALQLVKRENLILLCKKFKIDAHIGRKYIIPEMHKYAAQKNVLGQSNKANLYKCIKAEIGECFRISTDMLNLLSAFLTVYSPNLMDTGQLMDPLNTQTELISQLMFTLLQQQIGELTFAGPTCLPHSLLGIYSDLESLLSYVEAKNYEQRLCQQTNKGAHDEVFKSIASTREIIEKMTHQKDGRDLSKYASLPVYLRKFTPPWVYCRCLFQGVEAAQRLRNYESAVELLQFLLESEALKNFCTNSRGRWYNRLALNFESHLKNRERSAEFCIRGIQDPMVGDPDKLALQNRLDKLSARLNWTTKGQLPFQLVEPELVQIVGRTLAKGLGDGDNVNHFYFSSPPNKSGAFSSSSAAASSTENIYKCSVEQIALQHFIQEEGFAEGVHAEGQIWHALFRLFFLDIIFRANLDAANVWISPLQNDPLDLNFADFYENRRHLIEERLAQLLSFPACFEHFLLLNSNHIARARNDQTHANSKIGSWNFETGQEQITRLLTCCTPQLLHDLFKRLCTNFRHFRSGFPDLTVWNAKTKALAVVEVKGPGDQLSTKQQLWLDFFQSRGVRAVVCRVTAKNNRTLE